MTYFTYFKDYEGDKITGKKTLVVLLGIKKGAWLGILFSILPLTAFIILSWNHFILAPVNKVFVILGILTTIMHLGTGVLFLRHGNDKSYYHGLLLNFRACICAQATLIALFNRELSLILFIVSYIMIGYIFHLYRSTKIKGLI